MKIIVRLLFICFTATAAHAQQLSFSDTIAAYDAQRIKTNKKGMKVLGAWGIANIATGIIGAFTTNDQEAKYFHEMNIVWGVINTGIAGAGLSGVKKEMAAKLNYKQSYDRYRANKKLYLINAGFDVLYMGAGVGLYEYGTTAKHDAAIYKGFGKSFVLQGVFLLLFDNIMFASHQRQNSKWYRIVNEITVANNGIGFNHTF